MTDINPLVSVVVPVRNEERFLERTLRAQFEQDYPPERFEVIVVDGQSTDGTRGVVVRLQDEFPNLHLRDNPRRLSSAARNIGVRQARGDYVLIVDGHCELRSPHYLRDMVRLFERHGVESLGRPQPLDVTDATPLQLAIAAARSSRLGHNPGSYIYAGEGGIVPPQSVAIAYRKSVFEYVGPFDESFDACEDVEFNHRLHETGGRCWFAPQLAVHYHPRSSLAGLVYQMMRYGRGRAQLLLKHPNTLSVGPLVPAAFLLALALMLGLGLASPLFAAVFCLTAMVYTMTVAVTGLMLAMRRKTPELAPYFPAVFVSIHVAAGWGVLSELMPGLARRALRLLQPVFRRV